MINPDESLKERAKRHADHQAMLEEHKQRKVTARERHHPKMGRPWHRIKIIPITLI